MIILKQEVLYENIVNNQLWLNPETQCVFKSLPPLQSTIYMTDKRPHKKSVLRINLKSCTQVFCEMLEEFIQYGADNDNN